MRLACVLLIGLTSASLATAKDVDKKVVEHLQDISVTIVSETSKSKGEGSGVIVTRKRGDDVVNFVWTAAHVVENLRKTRTVIDPKTGSERTLVEFKDAVIVKELTADGRSVGKMEMFAQVIRFSADEDLALLRVRKKNFINEGVEFSLDKDPAGNPQVPSINTDLYHVGSLLGQVGSNSMTRGSLSQVGRLIDDRIFDQTTVTAFPGSSGGGVFFTDGTMMGMLVRGSGETFNLVVPVRRIWRWSKDAQVEWAVDPSVKLPPDEELKKLSVEDIGVTFTYAAKSSEIKPAVNLGGVTINMPMVRFGVGTPYLHDDEDRFPTLLRIVR